MYTRHRPVHLRNSLAHQIRQFRRFEHTAGLAVAQQRVAARPEAGEPASTIAPPSSPYLHLLPGNHSVICRRRESPGGYTTSKGAVIGRASKISCVKMPMNRAIWA
jgi:hypothetical protein